MIPDRIEAGSVMRVLRALLPMLALAVCLLLLLFPEYRSYSMGNTAGPLAPYRYGIPVLATILGGVFLLFRRARNTAYPTPLFPYERLHLCSVFIGLALLSYLLLLRPEVNRPWMTLFLGLLSGLCLSLPLVHQYRHTLHELQLTDRQALLLLLLLAIGYTVVAGYLSYLQAMHLRTPSFDLATYHHIFYRSLSGGFLETGFQRGGTHLSSHCDPFLLILALGYRFYPHLEYLLGIQSLFLSLSIFPLYGLCRQADWLPWQGLLLCCCFLLHPAVHGMNFYEFHSLVFATPFLLLLFYAQEKQASLLYWASFCCLLLIREDLSLLLITLAFYHLNKTGDLKRFLLGGLYAGGYLLLIKFFVMPDSGLLMSDSHTSVSFRKEFADLLPYDNQGVLSLLATLVSNPLYALSLLTREAVLWYAALLLLPVLGVSLLAPGVLLALSYGLLFSGLSSNRLMHSVLAQYSVFTLPVLFALIPDGMRRLNSLLSKEARLYLLPAMVLVSLCISIFFGGIIPNFSFRIAGSMLPAHFRSSDLFAEEYAEAVEARTLVGLVPDDGKLCVSRFLAPLLANRQYARLYIPGHRCPYSLIRMKSLKAAEQEVVRTELRSGRQLLLKKSGSLLLLQKR